MIHNGLIIMVIIGNNNYYYQGNRFMSPREIIHTQFENIDKIFIRHYDYYYSLIPKRYLTQFAMVTILKYENIVQNKERELRQCEKIEGRMRLVLPIYAANAIHSPKSSGNVTSFLRNLQLKERVLELGIQVQLLHLLKKEY